MVGLLQTLNKSHGPCAHGLLGHRGQKGPREGEHGGQHQVQEGTRVGCTGAALGQGPAGAAGNYFFMPDTLKALTQPGGRKDLGKFAVSLTVKARLLGKMHVLFRTTSVRSQ